MDLRVGEMEVRGFVDGFLRNGNFMRDDDDAPVSPGVGSPLPFTPDGPKCVAGETDSQSCSETDTRLALEALTSAAAPVNPAAPFFFKSRLLNIPNSGI